jgi:hypothetical protein
MTISQKERDVLRGLAERVAEAAAAPSQEAFRDDAEALRYLAEIQFGLFPFDIRHSRRRPCELHLRYLCC